MTYELKIAIHCLPKSLNKKLRSNRFKNNSENKRFDFLIAGMVRGRLPKEPLPKAHIKIVRHFYRTLDFDGLVGSMKPLVDAIVSAGVLKDDSWSVLGPWEVEQVFRPKSQGPLIEVIVTGLGPTE